MQKLSYVNKSVTSTDNEQFAKYYSGTMVAAVANDVEMGITKPAIRQ